MLETTVCGQQAIMEDQLLFIHFYLTTFAPEAAAVGLNALVYFVITRSEKLQQSDLLRKDMTLTVALSGLCAIFFQIIANFGSECDSPQNPHETREFS